MEFQITRIVDKVQEYFVFNGTLEEYTGAYMDGAVAMFLANRLESRSDSLPAAGCTCSLGEGGVEAPWHECAMENGVSCNCLYVDECQCLDLEVDQEDDIRVTKSSGNVFDDLGIPDPARG